MKKVIIIFIFTLFLSFSNIFATGNSDVFNKANECIQAFKNSDSSKISQIENPFKTGQNIYLACNGKNINEYLYHVMLDLLFSQVDIDIEKYISSLSSRKPDVYLVKEISNKFSKDSGIASSFGIRYESICSYDIFNESFNFATNTYEQYHINIYTDTINGFFGTKGQNLCTDLYKRKLMAYKDVALSKVKRNALNGLTANKKTFMAKIMGNWEKLLNNFDQYISKYGIIKDQTPAFCKTCKNK